MTFLGELFSCGACKDKRDDYINDDEALGFETFYNHFDKMLISMLKNIDLKMITDDILFYSSGNLINVFDLKRILMKYTKNYDEIIKYLESAYYIMPNKELVKKSFDNYRQLNIKLIMLNELEKFKDFADHIDNSQEYNAKDEQYKQVYKLNTTYVLFFFTTYTSYPDKEKAILFFKLIDNEGLNYIKATTDSFYDLMSIYINQSLLTTDFIGNFYIKEKTLLCLRHKEEFINFKKAILFFKEFEGFYDKFVTYVINHEIFYQQIADQKICLKTSIDQESNVNSTNLFTFVLNHKEYNIFKPKHIRKMLDDYLNIIRQKYLAYETELSSLIKYYHIHYTENLSLISRYNFDRVEDKGLKTSFLKLDKEVLGHKENFKFLLK